LLKAKLAKHRRDLIPPGGGGRVGGLGFDVAWTGIGVGSAPCVGKLMSCIFHRPTRFLIIHNADVAIPEPNYIADNLVDVIEENHLRAL
jgi:ribosome-interacting GTPase 1